MSQVANKEKKIIFESKKKQLFIIVVCLLFIAADYYTKDITDDSLFWVSLFFLGGLAVYLTIRLVNPMNDFVAKDSMRGMYLLENEFAQIQEEIGVFQYFEEGFQIEHQNEIKRIHWKEIDTIAAYKEYRNSAEEICLDLYYKDEKILAISESIPGWFQLIKRLPPRYAGLPANWYTNMFESTQKPMFTILYDRRKRSLQELHKICFSDHNYFSIFKESEGI